MAISLYLANSVCSSLISQPMWLALCQSLPVWTDTGSTLVEPGGDYARVALNPTLWDSPVNGVSVYDGTFSFAPTSDWGTISSWALCSAATNGNLLGFGTFTPSLLLHAGSTASVAERLLVIGVGS